MKTFVCSMALAITLAVGNTAWAGEADSAIRGGAATFVATFNAGDSQALSMLYTEDGAVLPPGAPVLEGRAAIATFWQGAMDSGLKLTSLVPLEITQAGNLATDVGTLTLSAPNGAGGRAEISAKYIVIWLEGADGVWRLHRDMWNLNPL